jgi:hypothetical protein
MTSTLHTNVRDARLGTWHAKPKYKLSVSTYIFNLYRYLHQACIIYAAAWRQYIHSLVPKHKLKQILDFQLSFYK